MDGQRIIPTLDNAQAAVEVASDLFLALRDLEVAVGDLSKAEDALETAQRQVETAQQQVATLRQRLDEFLDGDDAAPSKNVDIYKAILREHGAPMHAREILERFRNDYGREPQGKNEPVEQIRNALNNGKKWFENVGDNTWWLTEAALSEMGEEDHSFSGSL